MKVAATAGNVGQYNCFLVIYNQLPRLALELAAATDFLTASKRLEGWVGTEAVSSSKRNTIHIPRIQANSNSLHLGITDGESVAEYLWKKKNKNKEG